MGEVLTHWFWGMSLALPQETHSGVRGSGDEAGSLARLAWYHRAGCFQPVAASQGSVGAQAGPAPQPLPCKRESDLVVLVEEEEE